MSSSPVVAGVVEVEGGKREQEVEEEDKEGEDDGESARAAFEDSKGLSFFLEKEH